MTSQSDNGADGGFPIKMRATCTNCGQTYIGGSLAPWLERGTPDGVTPEPRDDVSFRCVKGCDEVHDMEIDVLERREAIQ